jgi:hypothetical protein
MSLVRWAFIQVYWCPCKKQNSTYRDTNRKMMIESTKRRRYPYANQGERLGTDSPSQLSKEEIFLKSRF